MKYDLIQKIIIEKIEDKVLIKVKGSNSYKNEELKLSHFYKDETRYDAFDLIEDDLEQYGNNKYSIDLYDILVVANYLIENDQFSIDEITDLILYLSYNFKPSYLKDENFMVVFNRLSNNIKIKLNCLSKEIKDYRNNDELFLKKKQVNHIINDIQTKIDSLYREKKYIKISIQNMEQVKRNLNLLQNKSNNNILSRKSNRGKFNIFTLKENAFANDADLKQKRNKLLELVKLIENDSIDAKEATIYINKLITDEDLKDYRLRTEIKYAISKLKFKINSINDEIKDLKYDQNYYLKQKKEIKVVILGEENAFRKLKSDKKSLKLSYDIMNSIQKDSDFSAKAFKAALRKNRHILVKTNSQESVNTTKKIMQKHMYNDIDIDGCDFNQGIGSNYEAQINQLFYEMRHLFDNYKPEEIIEDVYYIKNEYNKISSKKYAFSVDKNDDIITIKIHVINISPYVSSKMKTFWYTELIKKLHLDYETDKYSLNEVASGLKFKMGEILPTIAYTFTFNNNFVLQNFKIDKCDARLRDISDLELDILNDVCNHNNDMSYRNNIFFEKLLQQEFIKYAKNNNLPIIYYGKYNDESYGKYRQAKKIGREKMNNNIEKLADILVDVDGKTFDNVCWRWYKNYKIKHFSLDYQDDFLYFIDDLGIVDPASLMGLNVQNVINKVVFNPNKINYKKNEQQDKIVNDQIKYIKTFNSACGFIEIDDFIKMVEEIIYKTNVKKRF